ncbi:UNVERIFIED_CONTAM: hypothetical protein HDU68_010094 [Siphonaria sp. JEL0065]|nr:hypothetical protein HDU68_010094 [Siphonaria sp. JEL0065]
MENIATAVTSTFPADLLFPANDNHSASSSSDTTSDVLLYLSLGFMVLAIFSFCLQIILNIHREVRAVRARATDDGVTVENYIPSRPLSQAQLKMFPIKVYVPNESRKQRLKERRDREEAEAQGGPSIRISIAAIENSFLTSLSRNLGENEQVIESNDSLPCCGKLENQIKDNRITITTLSL